MLILVLEIVSEVVSAGESLDVHYMMYSTVSTMVVSPAENKSKGYSVLPVPLLFTRPPVCASVDHQEQRSHGQLTG